MYISCREGWKEGRKKKKEREIVSGSLGTRILFKETKERRETVEDEKRGNEETPLRERRRGTCEK